jgi:nitrite reductase (NADH) small subunit
MSATSVKLKASEVESAGRLTVQVDGQSIVVFAFAGGFVAYHDVCPHQGGPVCSEGSLFPYYTARINERGRAEPYFEEGGEKVIACPWHGWEFQLEDGQCLADRSKWLRTAKVIQDGEDLTITT